MERPCSAKEKSDIDALQSGTKELFMGQTNPPEEEMEKEMQEYLDAKNKEVLVLKCPCS